MSNIYEITAYIVDIEKKISKDGVLFYILKFLNEAKQIKACISPECYEHNIKDLSLKVDGKTAYQIQLLSKTPRDGKYPLNYIKKIEESI